MKVDAIQKQISELQEVYDQVLMSDLPDPLSERLLEFVDTIIFELELEREQLSL